MYLWTAAPCKSQRLLSDTWWFPAWQICEFQFECFMATIFFLMLFFSCVKSGHLLGRVLTIQSLQGTCVSLSISALSSQYVVESRDKFWHLLYLPCGCPCALVPHKRALWPGPRHCPVCSRWLPVAPLLLFLSSRIDFCLHYTYSVSSSQLEPRAQKWFSSSLRKEIWERSSPNTSATGPWKKSGKVETLFPYAPTLALSED